MRIPRDIPLAVYIKRLIAAGKVEQFYFTEDWKELRADVLEELHNECQECLKQGKHTLSDTVHHTVGFDSWQSFCDKSKWVGVCSSCHSKIHTTYTNEDLWRKHNGK